MNNGPGRSLQRGAAGARYVASGNRFLVLPTELSARRAARRIVTQQREKPGC